LKNELQKPYDLAGIALTHIATKRLAFGGLALVNEHCLGGAAFSAHANDEVAQKLVELI